MMEKNRKNAGFTLVEVLVAITIMALTGGILLSSFTVAIKLNARAEREYEACQQAQVVMEKLLCSDTVKSQVSEVIGKKEDKAAFLEQFLENSIKKDILTSISFSDEEKKKLGLDADSVEIHSIELSNYVQGTEEVESTILCIITVIIEDDNDEAVYQLTGQRRIKLEGILSTEGGNTT